VIEIEVDQSEAKDAVEELVSTIYAQMVAHVEALEAVATPAQALKEAQRDLADLEAERDRMWADFRQTCYTADECSDPQMPSSCTDCGWNSYNYFKAIDPDEPWSQRRSISPAQCGLFVAPFRSFQSLTRRFSFFGVAIYKLDLLPSGWFL